MKAKYINPFLDATIGLFRDYLKLDVTSGKPYLKKDPQSLDDVSAIIGLAGEAIGAVVLSFSNDTAIAVISKLANKKYTALGSEVLDGVGELINIIAGNAKKGLEEYKILISLPGVITGTNYKIHWPDNVPIITIPFESNLGKFTVNVSLKDLG